MLEILFLLLILGFLWSIFKRIDYQRKMIRVYQVILEVNLIAIRKKLKITDKEVKKAYEFTKTKPYLTTEDIESLERDFKDILNK